MIWYPSSVGSWQFGVRLWVLFVHFRFALYCFCMTFSLPVPTTTNGQPFLYKVYKTLFQKSSFWSLTVMVLVSLLSQQDVSSSAGGIHVLLRVWRQTSTLLPNSQTCRVYRHSITSEDWTHASHAPRLIVSAASHDQRPQCLWRDGEEEEGTDRWRDGCEPELSTWLGHFFFELWMVDAWENIFSHYWNRNIEWND